MIFFKAGINLVRTQEQILEAAVSSRHVLHLPAALYQKRRTQCKGRYNALILHIVYHTDSLCVVETWNLKPNFFFLII